MNLPPGCRFAGRCPEVQPVCREIDPALVDLGGDRRVACHVRQAEAGVAAAPGAQRVAFDGLGPDAGRS